MKSTLRKILNFTFLLFVSCASFQATANAQQQPGYTEAKKLLEVMEVENNFRSLFPLIAGQIKNLLISQNSTIKNDLEELFPKLEKALEGSLTGLTNEIASLYAQQFTPTELTELSDFYSRDVGNKFIKSQLKMTQESMRIGQAWGVKLGSKIEEEARKELRAKGHKI